MPQLRSLMEWFKVVKLSHQNYKVFTTKRLVLKLNYLPEENLAKGLSEFFDKVIEEAVLI